MALSSLRGAPVVLLFYKADFSPVCGDELTMFDHAAPFLRVHGARVLGISVDGVWSHQAFADERELRFPLLSDFQPRGEVSRAYGVYDEETGMARRACFVLDAGGTVRYAALGQDAVNPGTQDVLEALASLNADGSAGPSGSAGSAGRSRLSSGTLGAAARTRAPHLF